MLSYDYRHIEAADLGAIQKYVAYYGRLLGVRELPKIVVRNNLGSLWLGRAIYRVGKPTVVEFQKSIMGDDATLERVVAHEMVHCAEYDLITEDDIVRLRHGIRPQAHGPTFKELAAKVNAVKGADFVTPRSDESYVQDKTTKPYWMLIAPLHSESTLGYAIGVRLSPQMRKIIDRYKSEYAGRLVQTTDAQWQMAPKIGAGWHLPRSAAQQQELRRLYDAAR